MAMTGGIGNMLSAVDKTAGVNAGNPQKLQKEVGEGKNQDMVKALALQQVKSDYEAAERNTRMQMEQSPKNVLQQREDEVMGLAMQQVMGDAKTGQAVNQKAQGKAQKGMLKNALSQQQQGAPQGMPQRPPQGIAQQQGMPQGAPAQSMPRSGMTPIGMAGPTRRAATGGLMRYAEGGSVEEEKKKKEKGLMDRIKEDPLKYAGYGLMGAATMHPIGRGLSMGYKAARALPAVARGIGNLGKKAVTKPNPNILQGATRKGTPLSPDRVLSGNRISAIGGAAGLGLSSMGGEEAPAPAPEAAPAPQQGQGIAGQPKPPAKPQLSALERHRQNKPQLPQEAPADFTSRFNTFAMNLADTPLSRAGKAVAAQSSALADKEFKRALAERETWAIELDGLVKQDVNRVSNLRQYATDLQSAVALISSNLEEGSGINNLRQMAALDPDNEKLQAQLSKAEDDLTAAKAGALKMGGLMDKLKAANKAIQASLGVSGQSGINLSGQESADLANYT